jgi:hypothetical protein
LNEAIGIKDILAEWDIEVSMNLHLDSNGAIGMIKRRGAGKVRHVDIKHLFIQEKLRDGTINKIIKEPTEHFAADLGTKHHKHERMIYLLGLHNVTLKAVGTEELEVHQLERRTRVASGGSRASPAILTAVTALLQVILSGASQVIEEVPMTSSVGWSLFNLINNHGFTLIVMLCVYKFYTLAIVWKSQFDKFLEGPTEPGPTVIGPEVASCEVQTAMAGLSRAAALRAPISARLEQRCQHCMRPIFRGDTVVQFQAGWCHVYCFYKQPCIDLDFV